MTLNDSEKLVVPRKSPEHISPFDGSGLSKLKGLLACAVPLRLPPAMIPAKNAFCWMAMLALTCLDIAPAILPFKTSVEAEHIELQRGWKLFNNTSWKSEHT